MGRENSDRLASSIVEFCRFIRANGLSPGVQQSLLALEAASTVGIADRQLFRYALRAALCSSRDEWNLFDQLFEAFWSLSPGITKSSNHQNPKKLASREPDSRPSLVITGSRGDALSPENGRMVLGASAQQRLTKTDFAEVPQDDLAALEQLSQRLLRQIARRLSRRLRIRNHGDRVDVRRTIRRSITRGGDPIALAFKDRKTRENRLVIFLDVSGSMNLYSMFLLRLAYALQKYFKRVSTFLFSTDVVEITDVLRTPHLPDALKKLSQITAGWSGGTKIGASLSDFNRSRGRKLLSGDTVFMILSDGWDTGEPEMLALQLRIARRRVYKLIWLNPLLGLADYQPLTRGMSAALPYVDVFAAAHNLESLLTLEKHL